MAIITGYFDDSRKDDHLLTLAGLLGDTGQWGNFENKWSRLLKTHDVPYLHMKEMMKPRSPFAKWLPHQNHRDEVKSFFIDVIDAINSSQLQSYSTIVRLSDLIRFNKDNGLNIKAYPLAVYACMAHISGAHPSQMISLVFDHIEKIDSKLMTAKAYASGDQTFPGMMDHISPIPLPKERTAKETQPIQAADFMAWETRKHYLNQDEWWEQDGRPNNWEDRFEDFQVWSRKTFGSNLPPPRKTLEAVARQRQPRGSVFDYRGLGVVNSARNGVW